MRKIYVVTDLGPGDGGKGGVVHKTSHMQGAHTILKVGGAQGSHGVCTSSGERFAFSQFGCGTFEGVRTHLTQRFIASPEGILNEANALKYGCGLNDVYSLLTVDEDVVCATPYHGISSRLKELARGDNPRGTIGTGVGEAFRYNQRFPELTIRAKDLSSSNLGELLGAVRDQLHVELESVINGTFLESDKALVEQEVDRLLDPNFFEFVLHRFRTAAKHVRIVGQEYFHDLITSDGVMVVESSHGVLTDHFQGFHPHTSAIRTLPCFTRGMLEEVGYDGELVNIGVTRAYQIRHGAGPMPTVDETMAENLLPGSSKDDNRYQGKVRVGPLDLVLLRYAIAACGGPDAFDGLAVTWFDQIQRNGSWLLCNSYKGATDQNFFTPQGELKVRFGNDETQLNHQEELGQHLKGCEPNLTKIPVSSCIDSNYVTCATALEEALAVPVRMVSFGPTERDKVCR